MLVEWFKSVFFIYFLFISFLVKYKRKSVQCIVSCTENVSLMSRLFLNHSGDFSPFSFSFNKFPLSEPFASAFNANERELLDSLSNFSFCILNIIFFSLRIIFFSCALCDDVFIFLVILK